MSSPETYLRRSSLFLVDAVALGGPHRYSWPVVASVRLKSWGVETPMETLHMQMRNLENGIVDRRRFRRIVGNILKLRRLKKKKAVPRLNRQKEGKISARAIELSSRSRGSVENEKAIEKTWNLHKLLVERNFSTRRGSMSWIESTRLKF